MQQAFNLDTWLEHHETDAPRDLEEALRDVPEEQRTLALLSWLHVGDLQGQRIQVPMS